MVRKPLFPEAWVDAEITCRYSATVTCCPDIFLQHVMTWTAPLHEDAATCCKSHDCSQRSTLAHGCASVFLGIQKGCLGAPILALLHLALLHVHKKTVLRGESQTYLTVECQYVLYEKPTLEGRVQVPKWKFVKMGANWNFLRRSLVTGQEGTCNSRSWRPPQPCWNKWNERPHQQA